MSETMEQPAGVTMTRSAACRPTALPRGWELVLVDFVPIVPFAFLTKTAFRFRERASQSGTA